MDNELKNNEAVVNPPPPPPDPPPAANAIVNAPAPAGVSQVGVFTTTQSLLTFSGATAAVTTISSVLGRINDKWGSDNILVLLLISLVIGVIIYIGSVSNSTEPRQKITEAFVALVNTFTIAAAALGIGSVNNVTPKKSDPSPTTTNANKSANAQSFYKKQLSDGREVSIVYRENENPKLTVR